MSEKATTQSGGYQKPLPEFRPETKPYWDACKRHEFVFCIVIYLQLIYNIFNINMGVKNK